MNEHDDGMYDPALPLVGGEEDRELIVPFVVVGEGPDAPYYPASYCAGAEYEFIRSFLEFARKVGSVTVGRYVLTANVPQIDLVAMHYGFRIASSEPWSEDPEWTWVEITNELEEGSPWEDQEG